MSSMSVKASRRRLLRAALERQAIWPTQAVNGPQRRLRPLRSAAPRRQIAIRRSRKAMTSRGIALAAAIRAPGDITPRRLQPVGQASNALPCQGPRGTATNVRQRRVRIAAAQFPTQARGAGRPAQNFNAKQGVIGRRSHPRTQNSRGDSPTAETMVEERRLFTGDSSPTGCGVVCSNDPREPASCSLATAGRHRPRRGAAMASRNARRRAPW